MNEPLRIIGVDLGAESGRVALATLSDGGLDLRIVHRFPNFGQTVDGTLRWDIEETFAEIKHGIRIAAQDGPISSIGVDTWAVDYGLFDHDMNLLELPYQYRDARSSESSRAAVHAIIDEAMLYQRNGIRQLPFNTIYQIAQHQRQHPGICAKAARLLTIPDILHFWLSGVAVNEQTNASSTELTDPGASAWDLTTITALGFNPAWFGKIVPAGTKLGPMRDDLVKELGLANIPAVITPGSHDTASAVAAVPHRGGNWAFISSGTWSLMGQVVPKPVLSEEARRAHFTNEVATDGRIRFLKNIMGLWIVQECRRALALEGRNYTYEHLSQLAAEACPSKSPLDVDDQRFFPPGSPGDQMPDRIHGWCKERDIVAPASDGALVRLVIDGLADAYKKCLLDLERVTGQRVDTIHIVGGGSEHRLLAQLTADACGKSVIAGPSEATVLGNIMIQAQALGCLTSDQGRNLIRSTFPLAHYQPAQVALRQGQSHE
jgi:rhamnulokinase